VGVCVCVCVQGANANKGDRPVKGGEKPQRSIQEQIAHRKNLKAKREKQKAKKRNRKKGK
jgi:hypothetical protein